MNMVLKLVFKINIVFKYKNKRTSLMNILKRKFFNKKKQKLFLDLPYLICLDR